MLLGVDVGGTFTDAVLFDGTDVHTHKSPTTPGDESSGVLRAVRGVIKKAAAPPGGVTRFVHGMTVGTNALLEERGARTALVTSRGFEDVLEVGRQNRPELYRPCAPKPTPLVAQGDRIGAPGRMGPSGEIEPMPDGAAAGVATELARLRPEAIAICLLFSYLDPTHEKRIESAIREVLPDVHISSSSDVLPRFREYERTSTTVIDAYLSPLLARYLTDLAASAASAGIPEPEIMRSSGGVSPWREAAQQGAWSVLSGPAGGAVGAGLIARLSGTGNAVGLDMGGTSCDVCVIEDGAAQITESREIGGRAIQLPMVDVHTVGAGGGSIAWIDHGGALRVGPRSAGADPGPACYGRGGTEPTVTDANLLLGRLAPGSSLAGEVSLDRALASAAIDSLASELGMDELEVAAGIIRLANAEMVRALRVVTVNRGVDPRDFALLPFGGAGPMHACELAAELGMTKLICPRSGGVLSALGLLASGRRRDTARTVMLGPGELTEDTIEAAARELRQSLEEGMEDPRETISYELRYSGQAFELSVEAGPSTSPAELARRFADAHEQRYGFTIENSPVELVAIRVTLDEVAPELTPRAAAGQFEEGSREVRFGAEWHRAKIVRGEPPQGLSLSGPAVMELPEATLVMPPGWQAEVDSFGSVVAQSQGAK